MLESITAANQRFRELWVQERARAVCSSLDLFPLQYPELGTGRLVFVGMNPSHAAENEVLLRLRSSDELNDQNRIKKAIELDATALGKRGAEPVPYYRLLNEFTGDWEHLDLFAVRDASQERVLQLLQPNGALTTFAEAQLQVFDDLLVSLQPLAVVVINAAAAAIVRVRRSPRFLEDAGHHVLDLDGRSVPALFSGMLTGQRALDIHSRERLIWHVRRTIARLQTGDTPAR